MSSPIHQPEDLDPALRYAPRWARDRIPHAEQPSPPLALRRVRRARPDFSGDRAMLDLQRQLMLDPDAIPEPAVDDARTLKPIVLRLAGVMGFAALVAWGVVSLPSIKNVAEIVPLDIKMPAMTSNRVKPLPAKMADAAPQVGQEPAANPLPQSNRNAPANDDTPPSTAPVNPPAVAAAPAPVVAPLAAVSAPPTTIPSGQPPTPSVSPTAPATSGDGVTPQIDDTEIVAMIKRGKELLMSGDIVSARLLLRRAADAGNAEAALTLGATFDPLIIRQLGAVGMKPDLVQAKQWYQRAAGLGSASAESQLAKLEQAQ